MRMRPVLSRGLAWPVAVSLLTASAWAQAGGAISTGGSTNRPLGVSGKIAMENGDPPPQKVNLEIICPPNTQRQGATDLKGAFNLTLGQDRVLGAGDASIIGQGGKSGFGGQLSTGRTINQVDGMSVVALIGCSLRAVLSGYTSDQYDLSRMRAGDVNTNVGTLFLHPLADLQAPASPTSLNAPKDARKSLAKARDDVFKGQVADAEAELNKAVRSYPKYAEAWADLGDVLQAEHKSAEAQKAYRQSIAGDPQYSVPYLSLARLLAAEKQWQDVVETTVSQLNPQGYYLNAVAQYNLKNFDKAMDSAHQCVKLDATHQVPLAEELLGVLYARQADYKSAAEQYRNYLTHAPPGANLDPIKTRLAEVEKLIAK